MRSTAFQYDDGTPVLFDNGQPVEFGDPVQAYSREEISTRQRSTLPPWFSDDAPSLDLLLSGFALLASQTSDLLPVAWYQTRLSTATGAFLDIAATDFFGALQPRIANETDRTFSARTVNSIFQERATLAALSRVVNSIISGPEVTVSVYEYGLTDSVQITMEDGVDVLMEDGTTTIDTEQVLRTIPAGSYPVGINFTDAAARYGTNIQRFEALVVIGGVGITSSNIALEDGSDLLMEDGVTTIDGEYMSTAQFQPLFDAISRVKPVATTVWVSIT